MNSFELNKIAGAVLFTLLVYLAIENLGAIIFATEPANPQAYIVEGVVKEGAATNVNTKAAAQAEPPIADLLATASVEKGARVAKKCLSCHDFNAGGKNKIGPALYGVINGSIAKNANFNYSNALAGLGGTWDYETLNAFLRSPKKYAPGTSMTFIGLRKAKDRANIIAYMDSLKN